LFERFYNKLILYSATCSLSALQLSCRPLGGKTLNTQGGNMRYFIYVLILSFIINGCKKSSNPIVSVTNPTLSVSQVRDSIQYTFVIPKAEFGIHDTLCASVTAYNQSAEPDTLMISGGNFEWSLKDDSGRTLMWGPPRWPYPIQRLIINSHQSGVVFGMHQAIMDTSGAPVVAGPYTLQGTLTSYGTMLFTLDLSLQ
jgi:hypothetical protein